MASARAPSQPGSLRAAGVILPVLALLVASPITVGAAGRLPEADGILLVAPTLLGVLAAPGYLRAVVGWVAIPTLPLSSRLWVRASFLLGLCAAGIGAVIGLAFIIPSIAAILSATTVIGIWRRLEALSPTG